VLRAGLVVSAVLALSLRLAAAAPATPVVAWAAQFPNNSSLEVFDDDSYTVSVGGQPWLNSQVWGAGPHTVAPRLRSLGWSPRSTQAGARPHARRSHTLPPPCAAVPWCCACGCTRPQPAAFHLQGTWWVVPSGSAAAPTCATLPDVDCRNTDLYYFNASDPQACCDNCTATPSCRAWTYTGLDAAGAGPGAAPPPWALRCYIKAGCTPQPYTGHVSGYVAPVTQPLTRVGAGWVPRRGGGGGEGEGKGG
jgi:hypothetical protein